MTHMLMDDDVQASIEAYRMDAARRKQSDPAAYYEDLKSVRDIFPEASVDDFIIMITGMTMIIDEIQAGELE